MDNAQQNQPNFTENDTQNKETGATSAPAAAQAGTETAQPFEKPLVHDVNDPEWEKKKAHYKSSIENAFEALIPGMQISVNRTRPSWCSGWLDTIPVEFDENGAPNIDLQTIKETFGGENLQLRFLDQNGQFLYAKTVHFRGIPPKEDGFPMEAPAVKQRRELMELERKNREEKEVATSDKLFKMMLDRQEKNYTEMVKMLTATSKQAADPFAGMTAMMSLMEKFDRFRGGNGMTQQPDDIGNMLGSVLQMFGNMQQQQQKQPAAPQLSGSLFPQPAAGIVPPAVRPQAPPPQAQPPQQRTVIQPPDASPPPQAPPQAAAPQRPVAVPEDALDDFEEVDLVDEICGMEDTDIAETVADLMDRLGDERGQRVFQYFVQMTNQAQPDPNEPDDPPPPPPAANRE